MIKPIQIVIVLTLYTQLVFGIDNSRSINYISKEDGLSQNYIAAIVQDKKGFMWFGTMDGLNCYDGYDFKVYYNNPNDVTSISCNQIKNLELGKDGSIWVGTYNGLNRFDPSTNKFKRYPVLSPTARKNEINCLYIDKEGLVWFCYNDDECLISLNPVTEKISFYKLPSFKDKRNLSSIQSKKTTFSVISLLPANNNKFWIGTGEGSLLLFDKHSKKFTRNIVIDPSCQIYYIVEVDNDNLCLGTFNAGFCFYNIKNKKRSPIYNFNPKDKASLNFFWDIVKGPDGKIWFGTLESGVFELDIKKKRLDQTIFSLPSDTRIIKRGVSSIYFDKSGLMWCGTNGYGLFNLMPSSNQFYNYNQGFKGIKKRLISYDLELYACLSSDFNQNALSFQSVRSIYANNDYIWVGGYNGLDKIDRRSGVIKVLDNQIIPYVMRPDKDDPENTMYIGSEADGNPLYRLNLKTNKLTHLKITCNAIYSIYAEKGYLWLGGRDELIKYNLKTGKNEQFINYTKKITGQKTGMIKAITKDNNGNLWVGIQGIGLSRLDEKNKKFIHYQNNPNLSNSLSNDIILFLNCDKYNNLWIGTAGGGLNKFDVKREQFTRINTKNGLPNDMVYAALFDRKGQLWVSTNNGICKINLQNLKIKCYNANDGLQGNEFNTASYFLDSKGTMFFGGIDGLTYFTPENIIENNFKPNVVLTSVKKFNKEVVFDKPLTNLKEISLSYNDKVFSLSFSALSYYLSHKNKYKYRLLGLNDQWINLNTKREISFNGLPSGIYTLEVQASNNDGIWTDKPLILKINVSYPFWRTWWFYSLCLIFLIVLVIGYINYRTHSILRFNAHLKDQIEKHTREIVNQKLEIEAQKENVEIINTALEHSNATKDKFFGIIAHDLRAPFNSILGFSNLLKDEYDNFTDAERRHFITNIYNASESSYKLLENLLEWARMQTGKIEFRPEIIDLSNITVEITTLLYSAATSKRIKITSSIPFNTLIYADENMVKTIVRNIVSNAIKFTNINGEILLSVQNREKEVEMSVSDNGIGISPVVLANLFNLDSSHNTKGTNNESGTGLGLILCKEFIERNGGTLSVESKLGKGSIFRITFPKPQ
jgi:signal transduction histidine kinase/ligand-binding sensor domain-containing protein